MHHIRFSIWHLLLATALVASFFGAYVTGYQHGRKDVLWDDAPFVQQALLRAWWQHDHQGEPFPVELPPKVVADADQP